MMPPPPRRRLMKAAVVVLLMVAAGAVVADRFMSKEQQRELQTQARHLVKKGVDGVASVIESSQARPEPVKGRRRQGRERRSSRPGQRPSRRPGQLARRDPSGERGGARRPPPPRAGGDHHPAQPARRRRGVGPARAAGRDAGRPDGAGRLHPVADVSQAGVRAAGAEDHRRSQGDHRHRGADGGGSPRDRAPAGGPGRAWKICGRST